MVISITDVVSRVCDAAFGRPLVTNVLRSQIVEAMIALALEPDWIWCAADYKAWDFESADGLRLEVKQSAYLQTWAIPAHGKIRTSFDIKQRVGRWEGSSFISEAGRPAQIYVFAYHGIADAAADHRDPDQWEFYVINAEALPPTRSISLKSVRLLASACRIGELRNAIASARRDRDL